MRGGVPGAPTLDAQIKTRDYCGKMGIRVKSAAADETGRGKKGLWEQVGPAAGSRSGSEPGYTTSVLVGTCSLKPLTAFAFSPMGHSLIAVIVLVAAAKVIEHLLHATLWPSPLFCSVYCPCVRMSCDYAPFLRLRSQ